MEVWTVDSGGWEAGLAVHGSQASKVLATLP
jgi:hypothetical protein